MVQLREARNELLHGDVSLVPNDLVPAGEGVGNRDNVTHLHHVVLLFGLLGRCRLKLRELSDAQVDVAVAISLDIHLYQNLFRGKRRKKIEKEKKKEKKKEKERKISKI